jgi:alkanesulfonate monooxygenase SsuD/methylene tetrahydromethanopterin reductase-like flavin-dependent oxidoreductase (luciferase family)
VEPACGRATPFLLAKYAAYLSWGIPGITLDASAPPETQLRRLAANRFAIGSPAQVVEALLAQHRAGVTHATMRVSWPGMPQADILAGLELVGRAVLPEVRRRTATGTRPGGAPG